MSETDNPKCAICGRKLARGHPCGGGAHPQTRYPMSI